MRCITWCIIAHRPSLCKLRTTEAIGPNPKPLKIRVDDWDVMITATSPGIRKLLRCGSATMSDMFKVGIDFSKVSRLRLIFIWFRISRIEVASAKNIQKKPKGY